MARTPEAIAGVSDADLTDTTAVVTGSTSGIGREMALALGRLGARVVVHGRDRDSGRAVVDDLAATDGEGEFLAADFASLAGVRDFADEVLSSVGGVDLLYNNAGGLFREGRLTEDGIEYTVAVNHVAPFLLTHLLLSSLPEDGRIVTTSSGAHRQGSVDFSALESAENYSAMAAYSRSKLANILFTRELARRTEVVANCFHPGFVPGSAFGRELPAPLRSAMTVASAIPGLGTSVERGAATGVYLGVADEAAEVTGAYFSNCTEKTPSKRARDDETARRLWAVSEQLARLADDERLPQ